MKFHSKKGFTLIELLVVVAIIGILSAIVLSALNSARAKARDARRDSDIKTIQTALEMYYLDNGSYPTGQWWISYHTSWGDLENILGTKLPRDPVNESGAIWTSPNDTLTYAYYSLNNAQWCYGQAYMLVYNKETETDTKQNTVSLCIGTSSAYGQAFVVGMSPTE